MNTTHPQTNEQPIRAAQMRHLATLQVTDEALFRMHMFTRNTKLLRNYTAHASCMLVVRVWSALCEKLVIGYRQPPTLLTGNFITQFYW